MQQPSESASYYTDLLPDRVFRDHAYLIARGVRALADVGGCDTRSVAVDDVWSALNRLAVNGAIPYVVARSNGYWVDFGYAAGQWAIDLLRWLLETQARIPRLEYEAIMGLLFGYSSEAIQRNHGDIAAEAMS